MEPSKSRYDDEQSGVVRRQEIVGSTRPPQLSDVVRDAMDHAHVIARDTVSLGRLEIEGVIAKAKEEARTAIADAKVEGRALAAKASVEAEDLAVRFAFAAMATAVGVLGTIFLGIALFLGLGYIIPSLAARFAIFALVLLITSAITAALAARKRGSTRRGPPDERLRHLAPIHPIGGDEV